MNAQIQRYISILEKQKKRIKNSAMLKSVGKKSPERGYHAMSKKRKQMNRSTLDSIGVNDISVTHDPYSLEKNSSKMLP